MEVGTANFTDVPTDKRTYHALYSIQKNNRYILVFSVSFRKEAAVAYVILEYPEQKRKYPIGAKLYRQHYYVLVLSLKSNDTGIRKRERVGQFKKKNTSHLKRSVCPNIIETTQLVNCRVALLLKYVLL